MRKGERAMRIKLIDGKYDGITLIVPDDTIQYRPEGTKEIAYENQAYRIGFDVIFKLIEWRGDTAKQEPAK